MSPGYDAKPLAFTPEENVKREIRVSPPELQSKDEHVLWNRESKILRPPKTGLWSVYCDGSLSPKGPIRAIVEGWLEKADFALFKHPHRACAYAEIDACVTRKKITPEAGDKCRSHLRLAGFPRDFGLWACGMIARRVHGNSLQIFLAHMWWEMVQHVPRDQIWFPFLIWKLKHSIKRIHTIDANIFDNSYFSFRRHGT